MSETEPTQSMDRRRFLTVLGVTGAGSAVLSGCSTSQVEKLVPYLVQSEDQVPGIATYYASTCAECATGCGIHVRTREGRAVKLEGNPEHPVNAGALCALGQASLQGLYNPGRLPYAMARNAAGKLVEVLPSEAIDRLVEAVRNARGKVAVLSGAGKGTFSTLLEQWVQVVGGKVVRYDTFDHEPIRLANRQVFGTDELPAHDFAAAKYIISFGADFLETWGASIENERGFAVSHGFHDGQMAKFVYVGPRMSLTGMNADQWLSVVPGSEVSLALGLANALLSSNQNAPADAAALRGTLAAYTVDRVAKDTGLSPEQVRRLADELTAVGSPSIAVAGGVGNQHPGAVQLCAAVNILNYVAGNVGKTVRFGAGLATADGYASLQELERAMEAGEIGVLLIHEANPVFSTPKSSRWAEALQKVPVKISTSLFLDETAALCDVLIPTLHPLERWDDVEPRNGIRGLMQPVMEPVFKGTHTGDVLLQAARKLGGSVAAGFTAPTFEAHLKARWAELARSRNADPETFWRNALQHGGVYDTPAPASVSLTAGAAALDLAPATIGGDGDFYFAPYPSPLYHDGRGANRPWLLENPDPVTKITWHSWVEIHPDKARELNVREGEIVRLTTATGSIEAPVYVYAGIRPDVVAVPIGLGHTEYGDYAKGRGVNPLDLLSAKDGQGFLPYLSTKVKVEATGRYKKVAKTEGTPRQLGRGIIEVMPFADAAKGLTLEQSLRQMGEGEHEVNTEQEVEAIKGFRESQVERRKLGAYAEDHPLWGMVVDLSRCTGCSACVTACYAENNIPWVGESEVLRGRELSWMRIERYFEGGENGEPLKAHSLPMMCQHCDNAPCEPVCPVYASYHTADGLNGQVYNRCVGTRYCGNNCPYKVRYFNWFAYAKRAFPEPMNLQLNPDVTVRARGVMEKCTFCVQRIRGAQNQARLENRPLRDGDVQTACQQACASGAIIFGNVKDPDAKVTKAMRDRRGYHVLEELNVRSSVTYLAKVVHRSEA